jgi:hypothetical protein
MTSETYVFGGPIPEKVAIGGRVRKYAAELGPGHVEAAVANHGDRLSVIEARAWPHTARDFDIRPALEAYLNS